VYARWTASGQNDPTNFRSFLPSSRQGSDEMNAGGKRVYILFSVLGCGTESEMTEILDCARRTSSVPYDDGDYDPETATARVSDRKGKRAGDDGNAELFLEGARCLANAISSRSSNASSLQTPRSVGSTSILETSKLIDEYSRLKNRLRSAMEEKDDPELIEMLKEQV
jgi:hypothetical protein